MRAPRCARGCVAGRRGARSPAGPAAVPRGCARARASPRSGRSAASPSAASTRRCGWRSAPAGRCWTRRAAGAGGRALGVVVPRLRAQHRRQGRSSSRKRPVLDDLPALIATPDEAELSLARTRRRRSPPRARTRGLLPAGPALRRGRRDGASAASTSACTTRRDIAAGARPRHRLRERRAMKVGIVGMPNAGKSSLFNALTRRAPRRRTTRSRRSSRTWPSCRCATTASSRSPTIVGASNIVHDTIDFHDIAGLVARRARGRGPGQQVPGQHPRDRRDRPRRARPPRRQRHPPRGLGRPARATSRRSRPSSSTPTSSRPSAASTASRKHGPRRRQGRDRRAALARGGHRRAAGRQARAHASRCPTTRRTRCATSAR